MSLCSTLLGTFSRYFLYVSPPSLLHCDPSTRFRSAMSADLNPEGPLLLNSDHFHSTPVRSAKNLVPLPPSLYHFHYLRCVDTRINSSPSIQLPECRVSYSVITTVTVPFLKLVILYSCETYQNRKVIFLTVLTCTQNLFPVKRPHKSYFSLL